jgi:uncharacterized protein YyaL (SSP411 family)
MKHPSVVCCMAILLAAGCMVVARGEGIQWLSSAQQAAQVAADSGKPILVYFRSANCHYCDLMQSNVWQDESTASAIMRDFVPLKMTREDNPQAVQVLKVKGFPSTIIFSADRQYVDRLDGYVDVERFRTAVSKMRTASVQR